MDKQEIIDYLKGQTEWSGNHHYILVNKSELISMIEDLDELEFKNYLRDIKSQIDYLRIQGPGKVKSLRMLENMVDNMLTGYWSSTSIRTQKVKVPEFVVEWFEENKHNLNFAIYELCEAGKVPVDLYEGLTDFERWFYLNHDIDTLIRMQDGYEVEEEPKWVVKVGNLYFCGWEDTTAQFVMNTVLGEDESIIKYKNEGTASSVAKNLGGTAEKA